MVVLSEKLGMAATELIKSFGNATTGLELLVLALTGSIPMRLIRLKSLNASSLYTSGLYSSAVISTARAPSALSTSLTLLMRNK